MAVSRFRKFVFPVFALMCFADRGPQPGDAAGRQAIQARQRQPLSFEANIGQFGDTPRFVARRGSAALVLDDRGASLTLPPKADGSANVLAFHVAGGRSVEPVAAERFPGESNYFHGREPSKWLTHVPSYGRVTYPEITDGVDLVFHGEEGQLEYDFIVAPGTDPSTIALSIDGADSVATLGNGDLEIRTSEGALVQKAPRVYQTSEDGELALVAAKYRITQDSKVGFTVASYDRSKPLVIDPILFSYATYDGAASDEGTPGVSSSITSSDRPLVRSFVDDAGNQYVVTSGSVPLIAGATRFGAAADTSPDVLVTKIDSNGKLVFNDYLGGGNVDVGRAVAVDASGNVVVTGSTSSPAYPTTAGAYQAALAGTANAFITKLGPNGDTLLYSTYFCAHDCTSPTVEEGIGVAVNGPVVTIGGIHASNSASGNSGFAARLDTSSNTVQWNTNVGAVEPYAMAVDGAGNTYLAGDAHSTSPALPNGYQSAPSSDSSSSDAFVLRLSTAGVVDWGTYLGASVANDVAMAIAVDASGKVYLTGYTEEQIGNCTPASNNLPTTAGAYQNQIQSSIDAFVTKLDPSVSGTSSLVYSTYLGGSSDDYGYSITTDAAGRAWVVGRTTSLDLVAGSTRPGGADDAFVAVLSPNGGSFVAGTYFGGDQSDVAHSVALGPTRLYLTGVTTSSTFPVSANAPQSTPGGSSDLFIAAADLNMQANPAALQLDISGSTVVNAQGGIGAYTWTLTQNGSGGTVSSSNGFYTAGGSAGVDIVTVSDALGHSTQVTITVLPSPTDQAPPLVVTPVSTSTAPKGFVQFAVNGGTPPYLFAMATSASGGSVGPNGGYFAGARGSVVDSIRVTDSKQQSVIASITVGPAITITPSDAVIAQQGELQLTATGGTGAYKWSATDGFITGTGGFKAPAKQESVTVTAKDSNGNVASVTIAVGGGVGITPATATTYPHGKLHFDAFGGSGSGYVWTLVTPNSTKATLDAAKGDYVAGPDGDTMDTIDVHDANGNHAQAIITVGPGVTITPATSNVDSGAAVFFTAAGGSGNGYAFSFATNASGASLDNGKYVAGPKGGTDDVKLVDDAGNEAHATINVNVPPPPANTSSSSSGGTSSSSGNGNPTPAPTTNATVGVGGDNDDSGCNTSSKSPDASWLVGVGLALVGVRRRRRSA